MKNLKLRIEMKVDPQDIVETYKDKFPSITAEEIQNLIRNNPSRFRAVMEAALYNAVHQSLWTREIIFKKRAAEVAVNALKQCSFEERKQILYELGGVTN